jgi:hypothetical protein
LKSAQCFASGSQLPTKVEPTGAGSAQPSYGTHIPIWYSIFPLVQ